MNNPFINTSKKAKSYDHDSQRQNRSWWEMMPMTYSSWTNESRIPETDADFKKIETYVRETGPWLKKWFSNLKVSGQSCLDLGSGSGIFSNLISRKGGIVISMDITQAGIILTSNLMRHFGAKPKVVCGDAETMPFDSGHFDFIFSWGVLHHTNDMDRALKEVSRVLKRNGCGIMMVYHKRSIVYYLHGLFWLIFKGKIFSGYTLNTVQDFYTDGFYHRYLTKSQLAQKLINVGLQVTSFYITQYEKKILPGIPVWLDVFLKERFGMCLIAEFSKVEEV